MIRGLVSGLVLGGVVAGGALVVASRTLDRQDLALPAPETTAVAVPAGSEFNAPRSETVPVLPQTEGRPAGVASPLVTQSDGGADPLPDTNPAQAPVTGTAEGALEAPLAGAAAGITVAGEDNGPSTSAVVVPNQPGLDASPTALAPLDPVQSEEAASEALQSPTAEVAPIVVENTTDIDVETAALAAPEQPGTEVRPASEAPAPVPDAGTAPERIATPVAPLETVRPAVPETPQGFGIVAPEIGQFSPGDASDGLPRIGAEAVVPSTVVVEPALVRYAVPYALAQDNPLMALILIDDGTLDVAALTGFPVPLTIAIDPLSPSAGARMVALRGAGLEIAVLTPVPAGATPADVEITFQAFLDAVPQAVAVMDLPEALLQESRPRASQVVEILAETGHGMVTYDRGLNSGIQIAAGKGVKATTVFRVFDDGEKDSAAIKRFLDQGAFRAGQVGPVVLVGQARTEALVAISEWSLGNRAATVSLAPVSAVLSAR